jgi:protein tyrosine phosphatase (PTP) superfamily phosphohydrolase (DUF442 family)
MTMPLDEIYNAIIVDDKTVTAGQPTEDQLKLAAAEGFTTVINLAPTDSRSLNDEPGLVRDLGMTYVYIPVKWDNPTDSDFEAFAQAMNEHPEGKTLIHCVANFRVTAFYSLYAQKQLGWSPEQAEAFRAKIWNGSDNPIWEDFIARTTAQISR